MVFGKDLDECKKRRRVEVDRYYWTVHLTLGLKEFFDTKQIGCKFISAEPTFRVLNSTKTVKPDIVLQYDNNKKGILSDIKTSVPEHEYYLRERLKQLELYSNEVEGWETPTKRVSEHSILLLCNTVDSDLVVKKIEEWTSKGELNLSKEICVAEWGIFRSLKFGETKDVLLIKHKMGKTGCDELDNWFKKNIKIEVDSLFDKYEICRFVRKEPPVEYTVIQLWDTIFPSINELPEDFMVNIKEIIDLAQDYFTSWSGISGECSQVRISWIKKAMKVLCDVGLAKENGNESDSFKIFYGKKLRKDFFDYITEQLCRNSMKDLKEKTLEEPSDQAQTVLVEFDK